MRVEDCDVTGTDFPRSIRLNTDNTQFDKIISRTNETVANQGYGVCSLDVAVSSL